MDNSSLPPSKPATAARMYDYYLGGRHHFPADREAAAKLVALFPDIPVAARSNRSFLRRAVRYLAGAGVGQFLDIGSGMPTAGNTHEIAQDINPDARTVYVDLDPVATAESLEILHGNPNATALCADMREPEKILHHQRLTDLLDLHEPVAVLMVGVLHFVPEDAEAYSIAARLTDAMAAGSYLVLTHGAAESFASEQQDLNTASDLYKQQTTTPGKMRNRTEVEKFFAGVQLVEPGVVWLPQWRPDPDAQDPLAADPNPARSKVWAGVGRKQSA